MKRILRVLGVLLLVGVLAFSNCAYAAGYIEQLKQKDGAEEEGSKKDVDDRLPPEADKGSPKHLWKALVNAGYKPGDVITTADINGLRNWSGGTVNEEINSLLGEASESRGNGIGVLRRVAPREQFTLVVNATPDQIDAIDTSLKDGDVIGKTGVKGEKLGLDSYRLDSGHLGESAVNQIKDTIANQTGMRPLLGRPNRLDSAPQDRVFTTTSNLVTTNESERDLVMQRANEGYTIAIATSSNETSYIDSVIDSFGANASAVRGMMEKDELIFSLVNSDGDLWAAIENRAGESVEDRTLNNFSSEQVENLRSGV